MKTKLVLQTSRIFWRKIHIWLERLAYNRDTFRAVIQHTADDAVLLVLLQAHPETAVVTRDRASHIVVALGCCLSCLALHKVEKFFAQDFFRTTITATKDLALMILLDRAISYAVATKVKYFIL